MNSRGTFSRNVNEAKLSQSTALTIPSLFYPVVLTGFVAATIGLLRRLLS